MKRMNWRWIFVVACVCVLCVLTFSLMQGCKGDKPTRKLSKFELVQQKIGGNASVFKYYDTTVLYQDMAKLRVREWLLDNMKLQDANRETANKIITDLWFRSGMNEISAIGTSVVRQSEKSGDLYVCNAFLMSGKEQSGAIWNVFADASNGLPMMEYIPENVWYSNVDMMNLDVLYHMIMDCLRVSVPAYHALAAVQLGQLQDTYKIDLEKILASVKGYCFFIPKGAQAIADGKFPGFTLVFRTVNDDLFQTISSHAEEMGLKKVGDGYCKEEKNFSVSIFKNENDVVVTTDEQRVKGIIAKKEKTLAENPEFVKLQSGMVPNATSWGYLNGESVQKIGKGLEFFAITMSLAGTKVEIPPTLISLIRDVQKVNCPIVFSMAKEADGILFKFASDKRLPVTLLGM